MNVLKPLIFYRVNSIVFVIYCKIINIKNNLYNLQHSKLLKYIIFNKLYIFNLSLACIF